MKGYVCVWAYRVALEHREEFEAFYGEDGGWSYLFSRSRGYVSTTLLEDHSEPGRYLTIDRWSDEVAYRAFRARFAQEYEELDEACEGLTEHEESLGSYTAL